MKKVTNAIKRFFTSIINWVKTTAWVQPLLIVGAIFGLIMSIKPISNFIGDITTRETESTFYDRHKTNLEPLEKKIDETDTNDVLLVIYIDEANEGNCPNCKAQEKPLEQFFNLNHKDLEAERDYEIAVLDINEDEFVEDKVGEDKVKDIRDHIEKYALDYVFEEVKSNNNSWTSNGTIDVREEHPISTPCIARYEDGKCVAVMMGYSQGNADEFEKFCYYDAESDFKNKVEK